LLVKLVGAAFFPVNGGLEAVTDVEEHVDGANGVSVGSDAFAVAGCLKVENSCSGGKDAPVDGVG
jgi:hypothetical protein